jgi:drug/metabolite transporter (DMT)-like permease
MPKIPRHGARVTRGHWLFIALCVIWGSTWIALKAGLAVVPPLFFAGTRFLAAGAMLLAALRLRGGNLSVSKAHIARVAAVTLLMIALPYGLLFWGTKFVSSGLSAVLDLALMPVCLLGFGALFGEHRITLPRAAGIALGVSGLAVLFVPQILSGHNAGGSAALWGSAAIVASAIVYALGSVLARPLLSRYSPLLIAGITMLGGGILLLATSALTEPDATQGAWGAVVWTSWLFLVLFGSLVAYTIYLELVRLWGNARTGAYAFVCPIVAVVLGVMIFGEHVAPTEAAGIAIMLTGAWLTLRPAVAGFKPPA